MRQVHRAGEKLFTDYAEKKPHIVDPKTGERTGVELFLGVLGASNFTYAEATMTQQSHDWIASHTRTVESLGGVVGAVVPDQPRKRRDGGVPLRARDPACLVDSLRGHNDGRSGGAIHAGRSINPLARLSSDWC